MFPLGYMLYTTKNQLKSIEVIEPLLTKTRKKTYRTQLNLTEGPVVNFRARLRRNADDPGDASLLCKTLGDVPVNSACSRSLPSLVWNARVFIVRSMV